MQCNNTLKWRFQQPGRGQPVDLKMAHMTCSLNQGHFVSHIIPSTEYYLGL